uniref:Family with sequence similarity 92, member A1 n=1 Tax=Nothobranchius furzeri TaxID=105023 RepID=A0A8C6LF35_NOTFU
MFLRWKKEEVRAGSKQTLKLAEKNLGEMCSILASYTRKKAKLRDRADLLVAQLFDFSSTEDLEFQTGLKNLAEDLAMVQDYRQAQVDRLETKVVAPLKAYGDIVKNKKVNAHKLAPPRDRPVVGGGGAPSSDVTFTNESNLFNGFSK